MLSRGLRVGTYHAPPSTIVESVNKETREIKVVDANGKILTDRLDLLVYITGEYWSLGKLLAKHGFSKKD